VDFTQWQCSSVCLCKLLVRQQCVLVGQWPEWCWQLSVATALLVHPDPDHRCLRSFLRHEKLHLLRNLCERRGLTCRTHKRPTLVVYHNAAKICHHLLQTNRINYTAVDDGGGRWRTTYYQTLMFYHYLYENAPSTVKWSRTTGEWFMAGVSEYDRKTGAAYHLDYLLS